MKTTTTLKLILRAETPLARRYELPGGKTQWVPRRVCPVVRTWGNQPGDRHEVCIEDWWLQQNPFEIKPGSQPELL